jgi:hypothetical protein
MPVIARIITLIAIGPIHGPRSRWKEMKLGRGGNSKTVWSLWRRLVLCFGRLRFLLESFGVYIPFMCHVGIQIVLSSLQLADIILLI